MSYRKYLMADDVPPSELYKAVELSTNLAEVGTDCISRQAVKEILDKNQMPYHVYPYVWDAINALPPANNSEIPNSSDTISRAKAIDVVKGIDRSFVKYIEELPPAQPEPKRGKWIDKGITGDWQYQTDGRGRSWHEWQCDQCKDIVNERSFYCPNCGAEMREVTE